jgi:hypothetical protein
MTWTVSVQASRFLLVSSFSYSARSRFMSFYPSFLVGKDFFEEEPEPEEDPAVAAAAAAAQAAQAEKRRLRKEASAASALSAVAASAAESPSALVAPSNAVVETGSTLQEHEKLQPKQAHVRGKSGQRKKMKEKYRDQGLEHSNVVCNFIFEPLRSRR